MYLCITWTYSISENQCFSRQNFLTLWSGNRYYFVLFLDRGLISENCAFVGISCFLKVMRQHHKCEIILFDCNTGSLILRMIISTRNRNDAFGVRERKSLQETWTSHQLTHDDKNRWVQYKKLCNGCIYQHLVFEIFRRSTTFPTYLFINSEAYFLSK